jgi:hypothetical protein
MFHSISHLNNEVTADGKLRVSFNIKDTCFSQDIELIGPRVDSAHYEAVAIFQVYTKRSLNVTRNLAIYYLTLGAGGTNYLKSDTQFFDRYFASYNYTAKYFKLVELYHKDYQIVIDEYNKEEELIKKILETGQS